MDNSFLYFRQKKAHNTLRMMKLPEPRTNGLTIRDFTDQLKDRGYRRIGWGAFASTYARNNEPEVIKVGNDVNADGYLQFLRFVGLRSSNPHLPYVRSIEIFDNAPGDPYSVPYYVVRMERLDESHTLTAEPRLRLAVEMAGLEDLFDLASPGDITAKTRAMLYVKGMLCELFRTHAADIKHTNVMLRGNTLVITDPVACYIGEQ